MILSPLNSYELLSVVHPFPTFHCIIRIINIYTTNVELYNTSVKLADIRLFYISIGGATFLFG